MHNDDGDREGSSTGAGLGLFEGKVALITGAGRFGAIDFFCSERGAARSSVASLTRSLALRQLGGHGGDHAVHVLAGQIK